MFAAKAKNLVKGAGQVIFGGDRGSTGHPLQEGIHGAEIMTRQHDTITKTRAATIDGAWNTDDVTSGISERLLGSPPRRRDEVHGATGTAW